MGNLERVLGSNTLAVPAIAVASGIFFSTESPNASLCGFISVSCTPLTPPTNRGGGGWGGGG